MLQKKKDMTVEFTKHQWDKKWDLHNRRLLLETFPADTLVIQTDFSATTDLNPQDRVNSAIAGHAIQAVFMVFHSPHNVELENGHQKRIVNNDVFHFWGEETKGRLSNDNYYSTRCLRWLLRHCREKLHLQFNRIMVFSDGCGGQYKSRKNVQAMVNVGREFQIVID